MSSTKFPNLLKPITLRCGTVLPNRALMGSMHTGLEEPEPSLFGGGKGLSAMGEFFAERARGGVGIMVTGGVSPNSAGVVYPGAAKMSTRSEMELHKDVTAPVHEAGGKIAMQILHAGRYSYSPFAVGPSGARSPISWFSPRALPQDEVRTTIDDYARCAALAREAGYDGVELMMSEGYLMSQFLSAGVNTRTDEWGGDYGNRMRLPVEIVKAVRRSVGDDFAVIFRLSMLDLVDHGSDWDEVLSLAREIDAAGVSMINTGIGWHEARVPTIATCVPRAGFTWVTQKLMGEVGVPLCTSNRINDPAVAERVLSEGHADMVSMARPFLADPHFVKKAMEGRELDINTCIGCNQACLDHTFVGKRASCLVNPLACYESELTLPPARDPMRIAVVGAGPAGLACATSCASRGHEVVLFDGAAEIGGQFNLAKRVPGKEEFHETIRYFSRRVEQTGVDLRLQTRVDAQMLKDMGFERVVLATGVSPRTLEGQLDGFDHPKAVSYVDVLAGRVEVGRRVAVIGAGGIGFDVSEFLAHDDAHPSPSVDIDAFLAEWGVDRENEGRGGLLPGGPRDAPPARDITLLQRKKGKLGKGLGKTTGWIHRAQLKKKKVRMLADVAYERIDDEGLHVRVAGEPQTIPCDHVVICAGQEPLRELQQPLEAMGVTVFRVGGAEEASELDAKRAIDQGTRLAAQIETAKAGDVFAAPPSLKEQLIEQAGRFLKAA